MTSRTNRSYSSQKQTQKVEPRLCRAEERRHEAITRYLKGDKIEAICRELRCSKSWLYKWRDRYEDNDPTWAQERTRRPHSNPRQTPERLEEAIIHLSRTLEPRESGQARVTDIGQALRDQAIEPLPSRRTIYRVLKRHNQEVNHSLSRPS